MLIKSNLLNFITNNSLGEFEPFYIYDIELIKENCKKFKLIEYDNKSIHFATMANIHPAFLKIVKDEGVNAFVNSIIHMQKVIEAGFVNDEIILTASALTEKNMHIANSFGVQINVDSVGQLERWTKLFPHQKVGIRCNIGDKVIPYSNHAGAFIGKESRLGFSPEELQSIENKNIIKGLHLYVGTDIFDIDYFINCYKELIHLSEGFNELEYLNFGGGFGVSEDDNTKFNMIEYSKKVCELMNKFSESRQRSIKLILEPGRIIGGNSGYFVCFVSDVKQRGDIRLVGLNASTVQFSRPLMYPDFAKHPVQVIRDGKLIVSEKLFNTTIYGCSTYSRDIFTKNINLPDIQNGDIIVFGNAGSYSASSYMTFLGFKKPEEFFI